MNETRRSAGLLSLVIGMAIFLVITQLDKNWNFLYPTMWLFATMFYVWLGLSVANKIGMILNQKLIPANLYACIVFMVMCFISIFFHSLPDSGTTFLNDILYAVFIFGMLLVDFFDIFSEE